MIKVKFLESPLGFLTLTKGFLMQDYVLNNLFLTLSQERIKYPQPGHYWIVSVNDEIVGCAMQSPLNFGINISQMPEVVIEKVVKSLSDKSQFAPGINGDAPTVARFAGKWMEINKIGAFPVHAQRVYELDSLNTKQSPAVTGKIRLATTNDKVLLINWLTDFYNEINETQMDPKEFVEERLSENRFWIWEDNGPVSMICHSNSVENVTRIQIVFTPFSKRKRGYSSACVDAIAKKLLKKKQKVILYTDLGNPISNYVFMRLGFKARHEILKYMFGNSKI